MNRRSYVTMSFIYGKLLALASRCLLLMYKAIIFHSIVSILLLAVLYSLLLAIDRPWSVPSPAAISLLSIL
jgi:hypothetical protein